MNTVLACTVAVLTTLALPTLGQLTQSASQTQSQAATPSASPSVAPRAWLISRVAGTGALGVAADGGMGACVERGDRH